jgi:hypothetical protein
MSGNVEDVLGSITHIPFHVQFLSPLIIASIAIKLFAVTQLIADRDVWEGWREVGD